MRGAFVTSSLILLVVLAVSCGSSDPAGAGTQNDFGVRMARMSLWREAMFRFKRAVAIAPNDAMAHNNLAVAYEANGEFDKAAEEYRTAIRLDKSNAHIQKNYSRFVEFSQRNKKRQQRATAATTTATPASTTTAAPAPPAPTDTTATTTTAPPTPVPPPPTGGSR